MQGIAHGQTHVTRVDKPHLTIKFNVLAQVHPCDVIPPIDSNCSLQPRERDFRLALAQQPAGTLDTGRAAAACAHCTIGLNKAQENDTE